MPTTVRLRSFFTRLLSKIIRIKIHKIIILPVVLKECETCYRTLKEKCRPRVFENRALMRILGTKRDEIIGRWRELHNGELHNLYSLPAIIIIIKLRRIRWTAYVECMGVKMNEHSVSMRKPEGRRPLGRPRRRLDDNIKMDLRGIGWGVMD
jgi:hypothetical protein